MNFIHGSSRSEVAVELKYCERCGGLWLRRAGQDDVYCKTCREHQANVLSGLRGVRGEKRKPVSVRIGYMQGVAQLEVRA